MAKQVGATGSTHGKANSMKVPKLSKDKPRKTIAYSRGGRKKP